MLRPKSLWCCSLWHGKGEVDLIEDVPKSDQHQAINIRYSLLKGNLSESNHQRTVRLFVAQIRNIFSSLCNLDLQAVVHFCHLA